MNNSRIIFYPVGNGDTTLIQTKAGQNIIIDCYITNDANDPENKERYNVINGEMGLHKLLPKRRDVLYTDVFALTHPHDDHFLGFDNTYHVGSPNKVEKGKVLIDELWFTPRILIDTDIAEKAEVIKNEIKRRLKLHNDGKEEKDMPGNRIRMVGYSDEKKVSVPDKLITVAGSTIPSINGVMNSDVKIRVLGPTNEETTEAENLNETSMILEFAFYEGGKETCVALFAGDAGSSNWSRVIEKNPELTFDILLSPHHCSFTFFNDSRSEGDEYIAVPEILNFLENAQPGCCIIASSKVIKNDDKNPPHYDAKLLYLERTSEKKGEFICLAEYPSVNAPLPLVLEIVSGGYRKSEKHKFIESDKSSRVVEKPRTYG